MKKKNGFTLVELMAVIIVLGLITAIAVPVYNNTNRKVKEKEYENVVTAIEVASEKYAEKTSKVKFSVQELVDKGEYEADNEQGDVINPIDKKKLNCHIINIDYENENYHATFTEEDDCTTAEEIAARPGVTITATKESGASLEIKDGATAWSNENVTLMAELTDNNVTIKKYAWYAGNTKINDADDAKHTVTATTMINTPYQVRITIEKDGKELTVHGTVIVKIDKQLPILDKLNVLDVDEWKNINKTVEYHATDLNGSGIKGIYIGTETSCTKNLDYTKLTNIEGSTDLDNGSYIV